MPDNVERAAKVIRDVRSKVLDDYQTGSFPPERSEVMYAKALDRAKLLAAPSDGDLRDALKKVLLSEGCSPGSSIHSWRCEYPERYGDCDCVGEVVDQLLPIIAAHVAERERKLREEIAGEIGREQLDRHMEYGEAGDPVNDFERGWRGGNVQALKRAEQIARGE